MYNIYEYEQMWAASPLRSYHVEGATWSPLCSDALASQVDSYQQAQINRDKYMLGTFLILNFHFIPSVFPSS